MRRDPNALSARLTAMSFTEIPISERDRIDAVEWPTQPWVQINGPREGSSSQSMTMVSYTSQPGQSGEAGRAGLAGAAAAPSTNQIDMSVLSAQKMAAMHAGSQMNQSAWNGINTNPQHDQEGPRADQAAGGYGSGGYASWGKAMGGTGKGGEVKIGMLGQRQYVAGDGQGGEAEGTGVVGGAGHAGTVSLKDDRGRSCCRCM
ncbi:hypothetical protein GQ53DRAFT_465125 [Thozetella sp. PMI_491]|nr:hypothetical protein GQ53DRAFT_465125 [Thozetella sp. PMI_491]